MGSIGTGAVRLLIGQALAHSAAHRLDCSFGVGDFKRCALIVSKVEFGQVPL